MEYCNCVIIHPFSLAEAIISGKVNADLGEIHNVYEITCLINENLFGDHPTTFSHRWQS